MFEWMKNKKAISPILALLIVLGVTIVVGAVFYAWGSGLFNNSQQSTQSALEGTTSTITYAAGAIGVGVPKEIDVEGDLDLTYPTPDYKLSHLTTTDYGSYDERLIVPVPLTLENYYDSTLTNVKIESDGATEVAGLTLKKITLNYNGQNYDAYLLCTNDGTPFKGILNRTGIYPDATWTGDDGNNYTSVYYILAPNSVTGVAAVDGSKDLSVTTAKKWPYSQNDVQSMRLYAGGFNNMWYACAVNGSYSSWTNTLTATKFIGWNTAQAFYKYKTPIDAKFYTSEWDVGTLHKGEKVSKEIFFFFGSSMGFQEEPSGETTVKIPVKVVSDQGVYKQVDVNIVLKDRL
ncbi:TPA: hypothetical protein HA335_04135 [Methanocaldococcus jannaschii]|uniref:Uncharacterized protein MJ1402 n=2 Tax=Methanocaldococcus jannaschii TaxID=2190 RepID=Y1402_METJA|nr:archaellin/type IV pilin N-terminal domain-containing protein [Methanocaldococcus jannaschii]Q58797.1 RecName: Full=Uncharacterized protein MJ1402; Flags: Precursor [Methanocaldococcus jannaschii DSM 2661]AAB99412.1 hypothetical protein MJ_1402 [Methanocaldococcus jannaschii DSM 2661]HII59758.1 hypothetical protein [Methanocaldococcus jannaschii]